MKRLGILFFVLLITATPAKASSEKLKEFGKAYAVTTLASSILAMFAMIPASINLEDTIRNFATGSQIAQGSGIGMFLVSLCSPFEEGRSAGIATLGLATAISQGLGFYTDITIWKQWGNPKFSATVLGGVTANGILNLLPHAAFLIGGVGLGISQLINRTRQPDFHQAA